MIIITFLLKFFDCALGTIKNVFLIKERYFISSICNSLSAMLFIFVADIMANSASEDKFLIAGIVFLANLTGSYFPPKILDKMEKDKLFIYVVTSDTLDNGCDFADKLREMNIGVATSIVRDKKMNKTLCCHAFAENKVQSSAINHLIQPNFKFHIMTTTPVE